jgi:glycine/D-amino acid oxidase-like deaminating enzyme
MYDAVVIGGGMYGCALARHLRRRQSRILVLEEGSALLQRASYANQARVHHGYHYPRSLLTALRSRANYARFRQEYAACLDQSFTKYYAIARVFSKVSASQFKTFCKRIGVPLEPAPADVRTLFNPTLIEDVFCTEECAFDAVRLRHLLLGDLLRAGVEVRTGCAVTRVQPASASALTITFEAAGQPNQVSAHTAYNCTYASINRLLIGSGLPGVALKHEIAEVALVDVPSPLRRAGITVMDGPFFSVMPFPSRGLHTLSHVRYTPHGSWRDTGGPGSERADERLAQTPRITSFPRMIRDAQRYIPALRDCRYVDSLWEIKTMLPASERDDSRPILVHRDNRLPALASVLGGKIDNIFDVLAELDRPRSSARVS